MAPKKVRPNDMVTPFDPRTVPSPAVFSKSLRMSYRIARGEQGVLTFEPYKLLLLPLWRFRTVSIAKTSSAQLKSAFDYFIAQEDFVGADMSRKFIQMGMTRAKRYANHAGGRKYDRTAREVERDGGSRTELPKSQGHAGMEEKLEASEVFKGVWMACTGDERYLELKREFLAEQKEWEKAGKKLTREEESNDEGAEVDRKEGEAAVKQELDAV